MLFADSRSRGSQRASRSNRTAVKRHPDEISSDPPCAVTDPRRHPRTKSRRHEWPDKHHASTRHFLLSPESATVVRNIMRQCRDGQVGVVHVAGDVHPLVSSKPRYTTFAEVRVGLAAASRTDHQFVPLLGTRTGQLAISNHVAYSRSRTDKGVPDVVSFARGAPSKHRRMSGSGQCSARPSVRRRQSTIAYDTLWRTMDVIAPYYFVGPVSRATPKP